MLKKLFLILSVIVFFVSCTFSENGENRAEKIIVPDLILENAKYIMGQEGEKPVVITGSKITFYSKDDKAEIEDITFFQDKDGVTELEGMAEYADVNTERKIISLRGSVHLRKISENMEIEADSLVFDSENETITAEGVVTVKNNSGAFTGSGFNGDLKDSYYTFTSIMEGKIN